MNERLGWAQSVLASIAIVCIGAIMLTSSNKASTIIRELEEAIKVGENK